MPVLQIVVGLIALGIGGDTLVRGAVGVAQRLRISPLVTGLVLVGFGTSMPELVTSLSAVLAGSPGIAVGNVVGSNIANILLILGLTAVIFPIQTDPKAYRRDAPMLALATAICAAVLLAGAVDRWMGLGMVLLLAAYVGYTYRLERRSTDAQSAMHEREADLITPAAGSLWTSTGLAVVGVALVIVGAEWMVDGSSTLARAIGVSETVIGLTIVAIGTSLPELATSVVAALRRQTDIAFGNIIGSNIFNILGILGATAVIVPLQAPPGIATYDIWILVAATALLLWAAFSDARLSRREGAVFLALYAAYLAFLVSRTI